MKTKYTRQETKNWRREKDYLFDYSTEFRLGHKRLRFCFYYLQEEEIIITETLYTDRKIEYYPNPEVYSLAEVSPIISLSSKTKKSSYWQDKPFDHIGFCFYFEEELEQLPYYKVDTETLINDKPAYRSIDGMGRRSEPSFVIWIIIFLIASIIRGWGILNYRRRPMEAAVIASGTVLAILSIISIAMGLIDAFLSDPIHPFGSV